MQCKIYSGFPVTGLKASIKCLASNPMSEFYAVLAETLAGTIMFPPVRVP